MKITVPFESYKGADGSSLSKTRCLQIIQVYEMLESMGDTHLDYLRIFQGDSMIIILFVIMFSLIAFGVDIWI